MQPNLIDRKLGGPGFDTSSFHHIKIVRKRFVSTIRRFTKAQWQCAVKGEWGGGGGGGAGGAGGAGGRGCNRVSAPSPLDRSKKY